MEEINGVVSEGRWSAIYHVWWVVAMSSLVACHATAPPKPPTLPPSWLSNTPVSKDRLCTVGASEPSFYSSDALDTAAERGRAELGRALQVTVDSLMVDTSSTRGGDHVVDANVMSVSSWASTAVLEKSNIEAQWIDATGVVEQGRRGMAYVLVCMPRGASQPVTVPREAPTADF